MCKNIITSKNNSLIKEIKQIRDDKKYREESSRCFIEGERLIFDTPIDLIDRIIISDDYFYDKNNDSNIINQIDKDKLFIVNKSIFDSIKDTMNSQGIIGIAKIKKCNFDDLTNNQIVIIDDVMDPGNLGTIFRISEAMGFYNIIVSNNSCDPYNSKSIRASMSSIFRLNIYKSRNLIDDILKLKNMNITIYGTVLNNSIDYLSNKFEDRFALILGNEANGINKDLYDLLDKKIKINMSGQIESLNVAVAYAIISSEIKRQKMNYEKI